MEGDVVEVGDDLVDGGGRRSGGWLASRLKGAPVGKDGLWCEAVPQEALDEHVLVVEQQHGGGLSLDWITAEMREEGRESQSMRLP